MSKVELWCEESVARRKVSKVRKSWGSNKTASFLSFFLSLSHTHFHTPSLSRTHSLLSSSPPHSPSLFSHSNLSFFPPSPSFRLALYNALDPPQASSQGNAQLRSLHTHLPLSQRTLPATKSETATPFSRTILHTPPGY